MIKLEKMNLNEFEYFLENSIKNYADEKVKAGNWKQEEALDKAKDDFNKLLPNGMETEENILYSIKSEDENAGWLWLGRKKENDGNLSMFIFDLMLFEQYRGKGFGKEVMNLIDKEALKYNCIKVGLHVFGHNIVARKLYQNTGYIEKNVFMEKKLK